MRICTIHRYTVVKFLITIADITMFRYVIAGQDEKSIRYRYINVPKHCERRSYLVFT